MVKQVRVLFVCTANVARSPMAAEIFLRLTGPGAPYAARAVGTAAWAMRRLTTRDLAWADLVVVMEPRHLAEIRNLWPDQAKKVRVLRVPDDYEPGEENLRQLLTEKLKGLVTELGACSVPIQQEGGSHG
jgi:predicted protein tyrosine phosphatase